jgi:hypothetical protein
VPATQVSRSVQDTDHSTYTCITQPLCLLLMSATAKYRSFCLRTGSAKPSPGSTFQHATHSGISLDGPHWPLCIHLRYLRSVSPFDLGDCLLSLMIPRYRSCVVGDRPTFQVSRSMHDAGHSTLAIPRRLHDVFDAAEIQILSTLPLEEPATGVILEHATG